MGEVISETKALANEIIKSKEYVYYQKAKDNLRKDATLYAKVNEFRRRNFEIQNSSGSDDLFDEIERLNSEYHEILSMPTVTEFFVAEQKVCKLMQDVYTIISNQLEFDLDYLEK